MELTSLGEFGLIDLIQIPAYRPEQLILGIGDDCAVLPFSEEEYQLVSCDLLVEDVHFIRKKINAWQLGYKAAAVNFSDIAAMGGTPVHIVVSMALPENYTVEEWQAFYQGLDEICRNYQVNVIGGDTTSSKSGLAINITVIGLVEQANLHLRKDACVGDVVFVTGPLGGSRAGLELILQEKDVQLTDRERQHLLQCHCQPEPCCQEIQILNALAGEALHGLNDISDGLLSECSEIAQASDVALRLSAEKIPVDSVCAKAAAQVGADGLQWALTGGEDYQLVGTMAADRAEQICQQYQQQTGKPLYLIGTVESGSGVFLDNGADCRAVTQKGYNHFQKQQKPEKVWQKQAEKNLQNLLQQQITVLERQQEAQRVYRHDLSNHLACLSGLLECGQVQQAQDYLSEMVQHIPQKKTEQYSQRMILNLLLNQKAQLGQEQQIDLQMNCGEETLDFLTDYDLCTLLGNLLDNGLEHSGNDSDAYLYLDIWREDDEVVIRMENSCQQPPSVQNGVLCSSKTDTIWHGKGMGQIQEITEQYHGRFVWQYDGQQSRFVSQCRFPIIS